MMFRFLLILIALVSVPSSYGYDKIVLLAPAAGDILIKLDARNKVVGITRSNEDFPQAMKIGSHIKPNIELIKGLAPDLIVISSNRFFSDHLAEKVGADVIRYDPSNLEGILTGIERFGVLLERESQAEQLIQKLTQISDQLQPVTEVPSVVYEITESPYIIAGRGNIINDIIRVAGGKLVAPADRKLLKFNIESVLIEDPDYYLYQVGPMNKNPTPPSDRPNFTMLNSRVVQVNQLEFSRANTKTFTLALELNQLFRQ
ncbi:ABC transporter substrate-binding protein [Vibrio sp. DW001]|uniref:ABC transporter substrate-binding protein n=1 Tax=Vibrio sp. DW001 TaxID=2912315 RepID=UPI0023B1363D|nr:ABC transporter substrate-binding protein [Vibrio sp. DW001]WED28713.1 ABC transporter substrate-binding protein [Vibrio sp. DW001]